MLALTESTELVASVVLVDEDVPLPLLPQAANPNIATAAMPPAIFLLIIGSPLSLRQPYTIELKIMKRKTWIAGMIIVMLGVGVPYFLFNLSTKPNPATPTPASSSQEQIQNGLQAMLAKKAEKKSLQTQLAVYEKLLSQFPDNKDMQHRVDALKQRLNENAEPKKDNSR